MTDTASTTTGFMQVHPEAPQTVFVTGGSGFLGRRRIPAEPEKNIATGAGVNGQDAFSSDLRTDAVGIHGTASIVNDGFIDSVFDVWARIRNAP